MKANMNAKKRKSAPTDDESPALTAKWFARSRPAADVLPALVGATAAAQLLKPKRGRPAKATPKQATNIRFSPEVLAYFRATGPGWQTRVDEVLRNFVSRHARKAAGSRASTGRRTASA
jgi:uncharacterized protein (DUF4415 family)